MKKAFKVIGLILLVPLAGLLLVGGFLYYRIRNVNDSHNLQEKLAVKCNKYIADKKGVGLAVGIIQRDKIYANGYGLMDLANRRPVDTNTIFEIGSITKVFTAELAQILVDRGIINWNDNICDILPLVYKPVVNDSTTLLSLVTHTSGFPRVPHVLLDNIQNPCNPYADMNVSHYQWCIKALSGKKKPNPNSYAYSNMGFSVLTDCIETKTNQRYDSLLSKEIFDVLDMKHTTLVGTDTLNFATGYDKNENPTCHWDLPVMYGAGAIRSTINDMLLFLKANMFEGLLYKPFSETQKQVYKIPLGGIGKAWHIDKLNGKVFGMGDITWHNGGTGGFRSYIGFLPGKQVGVVVLSNQSNDELDKLGQEILIDAYMISLK